MSRVSATLVLAWVLSPLGWARSEPLTPRDEAKAAVSDALELRATLPAFPPRLPSGLTEKAAAGRALMLQEARRRAQEESKRIHEKAAATRPPSFVPPGRTKLERGDIDPSTDARHGKREEQQGRAGQEQKERKEPKRSNPKPE